MVGMALQPSSVSVSQAAQTNYPVTRNRVIWRHESKLCNVPIQRCFGMCLPHAAGSRIGLRTRAG